MANERVIRIGAEFDASNVIKSINQIRQELSNIGVDTTLFKDINKDLDKISKTAISVNAALKNGIPEKDINSFLKSTAEASKLFSTLPDKIRQVSVETNNIHFSKELTNRLNEIENEIERIGKEAKDILGADLQKNLRNAIPRDIIDTKTLENITKAQDKVEAFNGAISKIQDNAQKASEKINGLVIGLANPKAINPTLTGKARDAAINQNIASVQLSQRLSQSLSAGTLEQDQNVLAGLYSNLGKSQQQLDAFRNSLKEYINAQQHAVEIEQKRQQVLDIINNAEMTAAQKTQEIARLTQEGTNLTNAAIQQVSIGINSAANNASILGQKASENFNNVTNAANNTNNQLQRQDSLLRQIISRASSIIGVGAAFNYITRGVKEAWQGIKELDKEFTQIAVVTDKTTSQLWQSFSTYSQMAQGLGVTTKDAVATSALYYQQGLDTADVMTLTAETIKMAQIAGMDFATATNQMTAALRGFNLEMEQASTVNDIFSTLAAHAAVSTEELAYALTKTASIADSAGMSIDTTSAFLTKMIETTREAPENIGTAMKSIVARFEELKKNPLALKVDVEGEEVVANKVEAAISLAGVALRDTVTGQFRNLDDVFLELAKAWDGLDRNTQRYIATIAAGSRQQSRFIAMMEGYDRTLELVELAQDSEGQSAAQFLKTLDSLDSKLNKISNSLEAVYRKFVDSDFFGGLLDSLNNLLQGIGKMDAGQIATFAILGLTVGNNIIKGITNAIKQNGPDVSLALNSLVGNVTQKVANTLGKKKINAKTNAINKEYENQRKEIFNKYNQDLEAKYKISITGLDTAKKELYDTENRIKDIEREIDVINNKGINITVQDTEKLKLLNQDLKEARDKSYNLQEGIVIGEQAKQQAGEEIKQAYDAADAQIKQETDGIRANITNAMSTIGPAMVSSLALGITTALTAENPFDAFKDVVLTFISQTAPMLLGQIVSCITTAGETITGAAIASTLGVAAIFLLITAAITGAVVGIKTLIDQNKSESEKLTKQLEQLESSKTKLEEASEKSTAEASVEKTQYKKLQKLVDTYDELIDKTNRTNDENEKLTNTISNLANDFPDLISSYDEAGNAVLKQRKEWENIINLQKESTKLAMSAALGDKTSLVTTKLKITETERKQGETRREEYFKEHYGVSKEEKVGIRTVTNDTPDKIIGSIANQFTYGKSSGRSRDIINNLFGYDINSLAKIFNVDANLSLNEEEFKKLLENLSVAKNEEETIKAAKEYLQKNYVSATSSKEEIQHVIDNYLNGDSVKKSLSDFRINLQGYNNKDNSVLEKRQKEELAELEETYNDYIFNYINTFQKDSIDGYQNTLVKNLINVGGKKSAEYAQQLPQLEDILADKNKQDSFNKFIDKLGESGVYTSEEISNISAYDLDNEENKQKITQAYADLIADYNNKFAINLSEQLSKLKEYFNNDENKINLINTDVMSLNKSGLEELGKALDEAYKNKILSDDIYQDWKKRIDDVGTYITDNFSDGFQEAAEKLSVAFTQLLIDKGIKENEISVILDSFSNIDPTKMGKLVEAITSVTDWGDIDQLKSLVTIFYDCGDSAEDAAEHVLSLNKALDGVAKLNITKDDFSAYFNQLGKDVQDTAKDFKDLYSALEEFNENGRLSAQTIIDLIAAGKVEYLTVDKNTKALKLNTQAIEENWHEAMTQATAKLDMQIAEQEAAQAGLKLQLSVEKRKLEILKESKKRSGVITAAELTELKKLEDTHAVDIINGQIQTNAEVISQNNQLFEDLYNNNEQGYKQLVEQAIHYGQEIQKALAGEVTSIAEGKRKEFNSKVLSEYWSNLEDRKASAKAKAISGTTEVYKFDPTELDTLIEEEDRLITALEQEIEDRDTVLKQLAEVRSKIKEVTTDSTWADYMKDTGKATKDADKELKEYISTLERFYNLNKEIEEVNRKQSKAKKAFDRNPTEENAQEYINETVNKGKLGLKQKKSGEEQEQVDRTYARKEFKQLFDEKGLKIDDSNLEKLFTKFNLQEGATGQLNQREFEKWLIEGKENGTVTYDNAKDIESLFKEWLGLIDSDIKMQIDGQQDYEDSIIELEDFKEEIDKLKKALDPLVAIKSGIEASNKILELAKESLNEYYESGGKEGTNIAQYAHTVGSAMNYNDATIGKLENYKSSLTAENADLMKYVTDLGNGIWTYDYSTIGQLTDQKTIERVDELLKKLQELGETEEGLKKKNKELGKSFQEMLKQNRSQYSDLINKVANALAKLDQKEIDEVKKKYAMIQQEDDKYLDSLQKSINKQRQLRDQAKSYDDLEEQEKRLALLERDTSGANAAEIAALKKEIKDARQNLVDMEQDNIVNNIAEDNQNRKEKMDEETEFLQNVMDERTYDMQYYIDKAYDIVNAAIDGDEGAYQRMIEVLQKTDEAFYKNTKEGQEKWFEELNESWTHAKDHALAVQSGLIENLGKTSDEVHDDLVQFAKDDKQYINDASDALDTLKDKTDVIDLTKCWDEMKSSCDKALKAIEEIKKAIEQGPFETEARIKWVEIPADSNGSSGGYKGNSPVKETPTASNDDKYVTYKSNLAGQEIVTGVYDTADKAKSASAAQGGNYKKMLEDMTLNVGEELTEEQKNKLDNYDENAQTYGELKWNIQKVLNPDKYYGISKDGTTLVGPYDSDYSYNPNSSPLGIDDAPKTLYKGDKFIEDILVDINDLQKIIELRDPKGNVIKKFEKGGLVDYTGPAWVDGTMTEPEAFLDAEDTRNIKALTEILSKVIATPTITSSDEKETVKSGDTYMEFHINIDEIPSDIDEEKLKDLIAESIEEAAPGQVFFTKS